VGITLLVAALGWLLPNETIAHGSGTLSVRSGDQTSATGVPEPNLEHRPSCSPWRAEDALHDFPEFSIPGLDGVAQIEATLRTDAWPSGTIVIGGIDGLTQVDYAALVGAPDTFVDANVNGAGHVTAAQWVNCIAIWTKAANGAVERWIQPKLYPSRPEIRGSFNKCFGVSRSIYSRVPSIMTPATSALARSSASIGSPPLTKKNLAMALEALQLQGPQRRAADIL